MRMPIDGWVVSLMPASTVDIVDGGITKYNIIRSPLGFLPLHVVHVLGKMVAEYLNGLDGLPPRNGSRTSPWDPLLPADQNPTDEERLKKQGKDTLRVIHKCKHDKFDCKLSTCKPPGPSSKKKKRTKQ